MRIIVTQNVTLDGRAEMLDDWFDPSEQDPAMTSEMMRLSATEEAMLLGRQTFCDFRSFWPLQTDDKTGFTEQLNRVRKLVVSRTMTDPEWQNSEIIADDLLGAARALREQPGGDVTVTGSLQVAHALLSAGLVDLCRMFVFPVWQGRGRGYFPDELRPHLELSESKTFGGGVVYLEYRVVDATA